MNSNVDRLLLQPYFYVLLLALINENVRLVKRTLATTMEVDMRELCNPIAESKKVSTIEPSAKKADKLK